MENAFGFRAIAEKNVERKADYVFYDGLGADDAVHSSQHESSCSGLTTSLKGLQQWWTLLIGCTKYLVHFRNIPLMGRLHLKLCVPYTYLFFQYEYQFAIRSTAVRVENCIQCIMLELYDQLETA
ncbi:uncharacterized protein LOC142814657 [Rhipicephalus microplus]|uniref:uncharacterized protein LOC142814657 n=1 Tax=Rhipicephalus microplus TaxID=6941 RepID=UPI003F6BB60E